MEDTMKALYDRRAKIVEEQRALERRASEDKRALTSEEEEQWDRWDKDFDSLDKEIIRREELRRKEMALAAKAQAGADGGDGVGKGDAERPTSREQRARMQRATPEYREAFSRYLTQGLSRLRAEEVRALQVDDDVAGGFVVAPEMFVAELIKAVDDQVHVRQLARVFPVETASSLGAPSLDADPADSDWTRELKSVSFDTAMKFGKRDLFPHELTKGLKVSMKLQRMSLIPIDELVRDRLAYKVAITHEKGFLTGNGDAKPLGLFVADADGIPSTRDFNNHNTGTAIHADNVIHVKYALKAPYWGRARWLMHRDVLREMRKLKDGEGNYLWQMGLAGDRPDTILEVPYLISEYAPNTFTTGLYMYIVGDFQFYWIADAMDISVQVLTELYAETNQIGYVIRAAADAMPVLGEAFARGKLA